MKAKKITKVPKRIVYILGAGATQAEVFHKGGEVVNLMMRDSKKIGAGVSSRVRERTNIDRRLDIRQEVDIEKLISLLSATGKDDYRNLAEDLRKAYFDEIVESLARSGVLDRPELAIGLLEMHRNNIFQRVEGLSGIITLNHDNLFQLASQSIYGCVNLGFEFQPGVFKCAGTEHAPLVVQLHGSFNWKNTLPIEVLNLTAKSRYDKDILWIPPAILKETKEYPYNKLMGLAYEMLTKGCDILRIVGCSLSQNDWNLISLIFNAQYDQYHFNNKNCFRIELIMDQMTGENIRKEYSYLKNLFSIGYLTDGGFDAYKEEKKGGKRSELDNPFKYWLRTKVLYHMGKAEIKLDDTCSTLRDLV